MICIINTEDFICLIFSLMATLNFLPPVSFFSPVLQCLATLCYFIPYLACAHHCLSSIVSILLYWNLFVYSLVIFLWLSAMTLHNHPADSVFHIAVLEHK